MGCDIHLTAEYRDASGVWHNDDLTTEPDKYGDTDPHHKNPNYGDQLYNGRSYDLFSILANVRNGFGFAGVKTGDGLVPIAMPRGIPEDAAEMTKHYLNHYGVDGHSHSYHTVAELLAYDWTQVVNKTGVVGYRSLAEFKLRGKPETWSGDVTGGGILKHDGAAAIKIIDTLIEDWWQIYHGFSDEILDRNHNRIEPGLLAQLREHFGVQPVFQVNWSVPYYEVAGYFLSNTMPRLWRMGKPEDVRILFFFDN